MSKQLKSRATGLAAVTTDLAAALGALQTAEENALSAGFAPHEVARIRTHTTNVRFLLTDLRRQREEVRVHLRSVA